MKSKIPLKQYADIYRIVSSVGDKFAHGAGVSCQFYNVTGAIILSEVLKVKARPVMGAAFVMLREEDNFILSYAEIDGNEISSSSEGFHCWVETDEYYIDFTAPEYDSQVKQNIPAKMFQKPKSSMATSPSALKKCGDFMFMSNDNLTNELLGRMLSRNDAKDLVYICSEWFKKNQKKAMSSFGIMDDRGEATTINLKRCAIESAW